MGRHAARIEAARHAGLIDEATTSLTQVISRASLVIFCTPVDHVASGVRQAIAGSASILRPSGSELILTDAGSVKGPICSELTDVPLFIGSHPIAGSHRQGFEAADAELFDGRICVVTPLPSSNESQIKRLERFWQAIGMRTVLMSPESHDEALAMTSHLPHVVASALATTLSDDNRSLTGSGFRDTTRIAAGDPELWTGILMNNINHVISGIDGIQQQLAEFRHALAEKDSTRLRQLLEKGQSSRMSLNELPKQN